MDWWLTVFDLELYMDDSGTHEEAHITVAACYIASRGRWKAFVRAWNKVLKQERIEAFHMTDFMARPERGVLPYCNWNQTRKDRVYRELATLINKHARYGFAFAVPTLAFKEHAPERYKRENASTAFTFAVECVLGLVKQWYSDHGDHKAIQYFFEERKDLAKGIGFRRDLHGNISFTSAKLARPLQSADILAWNMRNHIENVVLKGLPDTPPHIHPYFDQLRLDRPIRLGFLWDQQVKAGFEKMHEYEEIEGRRAYLLPRNKLKQVGPLPTNTPKN